MYITGLAGRNHDSDGDSDDGSDDEEEDEAPACSHLLEGVSADALTKYLHAAHDLLDACLLGEALSLPVLKSVASSAIDR